MQMILINFFFYRAQRERSKLGKRNDVLGWVDQPMMSFRLQPNFFEKLRATLRILKIFAKPEMQFKAHLSLPSSILKIKEK